MVLSHRINRTRNNHQFKYLTKTYLQYRGIAIHSLNEDINTSQKRIGDIVLAGIVTFLLADVSLACLS
jgi:hypothetical protein